MISREKKEVLRLYNLGLNAYKLRKWDDAISYFNNALQMDPADGPSKLYLERSSKFKVEPPADDWDGVFTMTTK